ncbi:hypothetical protein EJ05DRAFT_511783 [Pseudovirgaria hyperparasitica]|uniref:Uncharacterized protein n=1 Tax=Pseudovirgaria hyperparasitica TaxID=470096 RepID=A0A6A6W505_9PEZI|nr:uncharacterized protein EJ05DRAFT_511783 [Pseudovirgaria hyperparasitica]KAF2757036.1 hypothetical protein EJ05DRAFT_511783 [Pseudovirgaria hyperparasitica]
MNQYGYQTYGSGPPPNQNQNWQQNQSTQWQHTAQDQVQQQHQQQQLPQSGYNPGTYGVMPGAQQNGAPVPQIPPRDSSQQYSQYNQNAPPPPPKLPGVYQSNSQQHTYSAPTQPQNSYGQSNVPYQVPQPPVPQPYYPPPSTTQTPVQYGSTQGSFSAPSPPVPSSSMPGMSESRPAYIPPSLSGQGVASYMPSNTNPLPGVYVPPPPDVPAWTQASQIAPKNKFKYTPPVVHPNYQNSTPDYGTNPAGVHSYQQPGVPSSGQHMPPQNQQQWESQGQPQQYAHTAQGQSEYTNPTPNHTQQNLYQQPTQQTQSWSGPQEPNPQHVYSNQPQSQPQTQNNWQQQSMSQDSNFHTYPQPQNQPDHRPSIPISQDSYSSVSSPHNEPISPLSHRQSMDFGRSNLPIRRADSLGLGRKPVGSSASSIKEEAVPPTAQAHTISPATPAATGASALGFGGPSDWEHFGAGVEEVDDTASFDAKVTQGPPSPKEHISELPSNPSPPPHSASTQEVDHRPGPATEGWPTPPAPAPATLDMPPPGLPTGYDPIPPPEATHSSNASVVSIEQGRSGTPAQQQWDRRSAPSSRPSSIASLRQPWQRPTVPPNKISETTSTSMSNDGGFVSPSQHSNQIHQSLGPSSNENQGASAAQQQHDPHDHSVMHAAHVSPVLEPNNDINSGNKPDEIASRFGIDDGSLTMESKQAPVERQDTPKPGTPPKPRDLIPDLDPWYAGSLERYIEMLRQEAAALAVEDKISIFKGFLAAESQARGIPYYHDLPVGPVIAAISDTADAQLKDEHEGAVIESKPSLDVTRPKVSTTVDDFVLVSTEEQYSPGGRPVMIGRSQDQDTPASDVRENDSSRPPTRESPDDQTKSFVSRENPDPARKGSPSNAYTPYRHNLTTSDSNQSAKLTSSAPVPDDTSPPSTQPTQDMPPPGFKPYTPTEVLTSVSMVASPHLFSPTAEGHRFTSSNSRQEHDLFFNKEPPKPEAKLIPSTSISPATPVDRKPDSPPIDVPKGNPPQSLPTNPEPSHVSTSVPNKQADVHNLKSKLPSRIPSVAPSHPHLAMILDDLPKRFPSNFAFISELTKSFEATAMVLRQKNEKERQQRQEAEEARTNSLFDNNEISYADIGVLEDKFKADEAQHKAQEDQAEYNKYNEAVFNEVYLRLQKEIGELMESWQETISHLEHGLAGKAAIEGGSTEGEPGTTFQAVQTIRALHRALEERHDRVAGAISERDKKYKKTQVQPLYAAGNIKKLKEMERHFDAAEKNASLQHREQRAMRLKELFDIVEYNVQRAVEQNFSYRKEILDALPAESDPEVRKTAKDTLRLLSDSSMDLMQALGEIERELCNAEFDVEVGRTRARPEAVDDAVIKKVETQGAKEVERVEQDVRERLAVLEDAWKEVEKAFEQSEQPSPPTDDGLDDRARAQKRALEEAKRRNGDL